MVTSSVHNSFNNIKPCNSKQMEQALCKALQAKNKAEIETMLCQNNEEYALKILESLPLSVVPSLIDVIIDLLKKKKNYVQCAIIWMKCLFVVHVDICSDTVIRDKIKRISYCIDKRLALQTPLNKLKGKLDLLVYQAENASVETIEHSEVVRLSYNDLDVAKSDEDVIDIEVPGSIDKDDLVWNGNYSEEGSEGEDEIEEET